MAYLLDANVFIQAKNLHYGLDFCPAFWDWLIAENAAGQVFSIEKVGDEILGGGDQLADWAADRGTDFFLKPDTKLLPALRSVSAWATGQSYEPAAVNTFLLVADYYLVAHAHFAPWRFEASSSRVFLSGHHSANGQLAIGNRQLLNGSQFF